ncbi:DNA-directed RNA polymerase sigma-70 factor [Cytophagales bacterium WSM2-2]|nr:DNA-directed RNA polymerase sigma-70 factor [Cytophagales bacterium WSM2-2]
MEIDKSYFSEIFNNYFAPLCQYAYVFCKDEDQAKEIVQIVFTKLWEKRDDLKISNLTSYLYQSVKNRALNHVRDQKKNILLYEQADAPVDEEEKPELEIESLHQAIDLLPDRCKEIFIMKRMNGMTYKQISEKLSLSEKTIENQMGIALKKLKESLILMQNNLGE